LARLSRLRLSPEEVEKFRQELSSILDYVEILDGVDTTGLEPTYQVTGLKNIMRPDEPIDYGPKSADLLKNAPAVEAGQFKVKRVL
jgi:aspartyl-tRNA(Asn)/glutamyl-tRNA(Gln) amidotransferase subunit C